MLPDTLRSLKSAPLALRCIASSDGICGAKFESLIQRSLDNEDFRGFESGSSVRFFSSEPGA